MSEFKRGLAIASASAVVAIGGFIASEELSVDFSNHKQQCVENNQSVKAIESCQADVRDQSGAVEVMAYLGMLGMLIGGYRVVEAKVESE